MSGGRGKRVCSVYKCGGKGMKMYQFPNPNRGLERFQRWVEAAANPRYTNFTNAQIHRRGFMCRQHFREEDIVPQTSERLFRWAVPTRNLPAGEEPQPIHGDEPAGELDVLLPEPSPELDLPALRPSEEPQPIHDDPAGELDLLLPETSVELDLPPPGPSSSPVTLQQEFSTPLKELFLQQEMFLLPPRKRLSPSESEFSGIEPLEKMARKSWLFLPDYLRLELPEQEPTIDLNNGRSEEEHGAGKKLHLPILCVKEERGKGLENINLAELEARSSTDILCRICLKAAFKWKDLLSEYDAGSIYLRRMIQFVLPELNLEMVAQPVICNQCESDLSQAYKFKRKWLKTEEVLNNRILSKFVDTHKHNNVETVIENQKCVELEELGAIVNDHDYFVEGSTCEENQTQPVLEPEAIIEPQSSKLFELLTQSRQPRKIITYGKNQTQPVLEAIPIIKPQPRQPRNKIPKPRIPRKPDRLPSIYNLFDEEFNDYFSRPKQHTRLRENLNKLRKPDRGEPPYLCDECGQTFKVWTHFHRHKLLHTDQTFVCDICGLTFKRIDNLRMHYNRHKPRLHTCKICERRFRSEYDLQKHIECIHLRSDSGYAQCHLCGLKIRKSSLFGHLGTHYKRECPVCGRLLSRKYYEGHVKKHHGDGFKCSICGVVLTSKGSLKCHIMVFHEKRGDFACGICGKFFVLKRRLKRHFIQMHVRKGDFEKRENNADTSQSIPEN